MLSNPRGRQLLLLSIVLAALDIYVCVWVGGRGLFLLQKSFPQPDNEWTELYKQISLLHHSACSSRQVYKVDYNVHGWLSGIGIGIDEVLQEQGLFILHRLHSKIT